MPALTSVTLISLAAVNFQPTIQAMLRSSENLKFYDSKIITPEEPTYLPSSIKWEDSGPLRLRSEGVDDYSRYFLYEIWRHVETPHVLVVQADGFVINPHMWTDEFLEFDYIGAPWPIRRRAYVDPFGNHQRVGNGGFSLRSKALLETPQKVDVPFDVNSSDFYAHMGVGSLAEDGNICVHNRHVYEAAGNVFAPINIAVKFSQELRVPEARGVTPFGFHEYMPHPNKYLRALGLKKKF